jgi:transposase
MRKLRDILRMRLSGDCSIREISRSTKVSVGSIQKLLTKAQVLELTWPLPEDLDDGQLARLFYPTADTSTSSHLQIPDWPTVHQELKRPHMTKQLAWEEYTRQYPNRSLSYSRFCHRYKVWVGKQRRSMRQYHKAGEKCFVDYAGSTVPVISGSTGETREAQIFVAALGASNFTYAEATWTQSLPDWLGSHVRMLDYFGGCTTMVIPDNLRSGVSKACRYDPDLNPSYQQWAEHYGVAVVPARPFRPRDKSKAEVAVQVVQRWILARLRHHTFFSLAELNQCIHALLEDLNNRPFKQLPGCRQSAFEQLDRPALKPLPAQPYRYVAIKPVKVNIDYHVRYKDHDYSVPHQYVGERLEVQASDTLVEIYFRRQLVATHPRKHTPGFTTNPAHMPKRHRAQQQWTPGRLKRWAQEIGPNTLAWVTAQLEGRQHPEQAYKVCLGLLNLSKQYPAKRLDAACRIANRSGLHRLKQVRAILKSNRDQLPEQLSLTADLPQDHENIRGPHNFH